APTADWRLISGGKGPRSFIQGRRNVEAFFGGKARSGVTKAAAFPAEFFSPAFRRGLPRGFFASGFPSYRPQRTGQRWIRICNALSANSAAPSAFPPASGRGGTGGERGRVFPFAAVRGRKRRSGWKWRATFPPGRFPSSGFCSPNGSGEKGKPQAR